MAKLSSVEKNNRRRKMSEQFSGRRAKLKEIIYNRELAPEDRFDATLKLAALPRNGARIRVRNRCEVSGRSRGVYRKFKMSRIALRELGSLGLIPGLTKASW
ncbi:MAG: 30S ribosomal protein S14 [Candidatus Paracaedimonas acanthamoebae]|uniref:Small ribosomal subunit protein uS14 n=1 Tax=Candidatus Paracaedimonas acanthamoebae TaxID=244581 RepID=A0A8J7TUZ5_9PROT|nr:30S ribosomal protein S14 [Candidatus Paracaedimonas acanthamoebae]